MEDFPKLLAFCEKEMRLQGSSAEQVAAIFNDLWDRCCTILQYPAALLCFEKTLETLNNSVSVHSHLVAKTHDRMATALEGLERIEEAIYSDTQATEIATSALGPAHFDT